MSFTQSISVQQSVGVPSQITINDTSTGSDINISTRKVFIQKADGAYFENGVNWAYPSLTVTYDILQSDYALNILIQWADSGGNVLYDFEQLYIFDQYNNQFDVDLTRAILGDPSIMQDKDYWLNRMILRVNIDSAEQAVSLADDIELSQSALDRASYMRSKQNLYF